MIISKTAKIIGRGTKKPNQKYVSGLTYSEKQAVLNGVIVLIKDELAHYHTQTKYKQVIQWDTSPTGFTHRNYYGIEPVIDK